MSQDDKPLKWAQNLQNRTPQEKEAKETFFIIEKQHGTRAIMLDMVFENGNHLAMPYAYMTKMDYDLSVGIVIEWGEVKATIHGRHLEKLYTYLLQHRILVVMEGTGKADLVLETDTYIERIEVKEGQGFGG